MATIRLRDSYQPLPQQKAFHDSKAKARGYGGAMGGGKSRALCQEALMAALRFPGIEIVVARMEHTAIFKTTRKTFFREVIPAELVKYCRVIKSGGEDFIEFPNGSMIHFAGLDDPVKWHSSEIGLLILDEAHQIDEDAVITLNSRLRQKCQECLKNRVRRCNHLPRQIIAGFNPENPGHWLYRWFIDGADKTPLGFRKRELRLDPDSPPLGDAEFVFANAEQNPYLPVGYVERELGGMPPKLRKRYLEGDWLWISGDCVFDVDRLNEYEENCPIPLFKTDFFTRGSGDKPLLRQRDSGHTRVYALPDEQHRYAIGADPATGRGLDFSVAYVVDLVTMDFAAEFRWKCDADLFAEQLHLLGRYFNTAVIAVESAGGFGEPVIISLRDGKGSRPPYPRLYRHRLETNVDLANVMRYGYPVNTKTRPQLINQMEKAIRERAMPFMPRQLITECLTFCEFEEGTPAQRAQPNMHDDCVMAGAISLELYRQFGKHPKRDKRLEGKRKRTRRGQTWRELLHVQGSDLDFDEKRYRREGAAA